MAAKVVAMGAQPPKPDSERGCRPVAIRVFSFSVVSITLPSLGDDNAEQ